MSSKTLRGLESRDTADDEPNDEQRVLDWGTETPIELDGGDVVFVDSYVRTDDGAALRFDGDVPVATTSVYSERDLRAALLDAGYEQEHIDIALDNKLTGETGRRAACIAEGGERVTDGGTTEDERETTDVHGGATCSGYAYGDDDQCAECQQRDVSPVDEAPL